MSSLKMKKFVSIKGVIDNIRQSVNTPSPPCMSPSSTSGPVQLEQDLQENLTGDQFTVDKTVRHGFPNKAISMAFDPLQRLLAVGTRFGEVRIFGRPGIDLEFKHETRETILQMEFIVKGQLLTACADDTVNLWDFSSPKAKLVQSLKLNKEKLTVMGVEFQDKWIYLGTERGNVLILNMDTFTLSGYVIAWNKCMDPMQKNHPGAVVHISTNPADPSKLLIGFKTGLLCLWDLSGKKGEQRYSHNQMLKSASWHMEGRQFVAGYGDGSLVTWSVKPQAGAATALKPQNIQFPHGKKNKETSKMEPCDPIEKVIWRVNRSDGESYFVFSGGLPVDVCGVTPSITFMQGKTTTLLEMENNVMDFTLVTDSPYTSDYQDPEAILVMLTNDLVGIDCKSSGYPCFQNPYAMDFNESPVTCCYYLVDCPGDLIPALYMAGSRTKKEGNRAFSSRDWPITGGIDPGMDSCSYTELVVTGHMDGSLKFWDASGTAMQSLYRLKTAKYFEKTKRPPSTSGESLEDDPFAISKITLCPNGLELAIAGATGQCIYFKFHKKETVTETKAMEIPIVYEVTNHPPNNNQSNSPHGKKHEPAHFEFPSPKPLLNVASQSAAYTDPVDGFNFDRPQYEYFSPLKHRQGSQRKNPGFHAELICLTPWVNNEPPTPISCLTLNSSFGLMAYGNGSGLVILDTVQLVCLLNMGTADLYGSLDPFQRMPKSPKPLDSGLASEIVRVDLSSYSQVRGSEAGTPDKPNTSLATPTSKVTERVKSPDCSRLQKAGSSADESNMSKSHSSSSNSLDGVITHEGVTCLEFADSFPTKHDFSLGSCLFVGTSLGSFIPIIINLPDKGEPRENEPVVVSPSGSLMRSRGAVLTVAFLDTSANSLMSRGEAAVNVKVTQKVSSGAAPTSLLNQTSHDDSSAIGSPQQPNSMCPTGDQEIAVVCTSKCAAVFALPSQKQMYSQTITEASQVVSAKIINFGGSKYAPCLITFTADSCIKAYSLPSLRPLLDTNFGTRTPRLEQSLTFADFGHGLYFCNPNELQKFSVSADFMRQLPSMKGMLYQDSILIPEAPKPSFLKGLFGGGPKPLDREELFGEMAGKVSSQMATHVHGNSAMVGAQAKGAGAAGEVGKAKMAFVERGQKLSEVEDRTEQLATDAKLYADNARNLLMKEKNRKWYQL